MKWMLIAIGTVIVFAGGLYFAKQSAAPSPGTFYASEGRTHVPVGKRVTYKTNPPTSGDHYADWTRPGVYDAPRYPDENLVHSLEHGYIIISYNCALGADTGKTTSGKQGTESASLSDPAWKSKDCTDLKKQLAAVAEEKKLFKLIVIPRPNMPYRIALTAWSRLDTMDTFDKTRIVRFIDAFRNNGPEQTME